MGFNLDFLYAAVVICVIIIFHFIVSKRNFKGLLPGWIISIVCVSLFVTIIDIVDSLFIDHAANVNVYALYIVDIVLYIGQLTLPFLLYAFAVTITGLRIKGQTHPAVWMPAVLFGIACFMVITTPFTGLVFSFDVANNNDYSHGVLLYVAYGLAVVIAACALGLMISNRKYLRSSDCLAVCVDVLIIVAVAIIQTFVPHLCLVGFGAACGSLLLYVSFNDSSNLGDTKTGAFEPAELRRRLSALVKRKTYFNVTFVTIDNRRYLSDSLGPNAVDQALRNISYGLMRLFKTEQVYKFQGARFCVLTYNDVKTYESTAKTKEWFAQTHRVGNQEVSFEAHVSSLYDVGMIASEIDLESFVDFLAEEVGTYEEDGIDKTAVKESFLRFQSANKALQYALENDAFEIFLQPLYDTKTGTFSSAEVLSRLKGEDGRYISPATFIKIAEDNGSIRQVSNLQFVRLCRFLSENRARLERLGVTDVKYNVSAAEITSPDRAREALNIIKDFGLDPSLFSFEVTENVAYAGSDLLIKMMQEVQAAGARAYMDDFGSGYANLETIFRLPFDGVKLDITLLRLMRTDEKAASFYHSLVDTIHSIGKKVVSEGVEEADDARQLAEWGVDVIQGYYYSKPLPAHSYIEFLEEKAAR